MSFLLIVLLENVGGIYPANYAETFLSERQEEIRTADWVEETMIPPGSDYGVYETDGIGMESANNEMTNATKK